MPFWRKLLQETLASWRWLIPPFSARGLRHHQKAGVVFWYLMIWASLWGAIATLDYLGVGKGQWLLGGMAGALLFGFSRYARARFLYPVPARYTQSLEHFLNLISGWLLRAAAWPLKWVIGLAAIGACAVYIIDYGYDRTTNPYAEVLRIGGFWHHAITQNLTAAFYHDLGWEAVINTTVATKNEDGLWYAVTALLRTFEAISMTAVGACLAVFLLGFACGATAMTIAHFRMMRQMRQVYQQHTHGNAGFAKPNSWASTKTKSSDWEDV